MIQQGSTEWHQVRAGMLNASEIHTVIVGGTRGLASLRERIRTARQTGKGKQIRPTRAMEHGHEHEPAALAWATLLTGITFERVGALVHEEFFYVGCSPDGISYEQKIGCEAKCPLRQAIHLTYESGELPKPYYWQVMCSMWITGFDRWLFVSHDPRLVGTELDHKATFVREIPRDDAKIALLAKRCEWFWSTV